MQTDDDLYQGDTIEEALHDLFAAQLWMLPKAFPGVFSELLQEVIPEAFEEAPALIRELAKTDLGDRSLNKAIRLVALVRRQYQRRHPSVLAAACPSCNPNGRTTKHAGQVYGIVYAGWTARADSAPLWFSTTLPCSRCGQWKIAFPEAKDNAARYSSTDPWYQRTDIDKRNFPRTKEHAEVWIKALQIAVKYFASSRALKAYHNVEVYEADYQLLRQSLFERGLWPRVLR